MGTAIQMAAVTTGGTENALVSIDTPLAGNIIGVEWSAYADFDTDNDFQFTQLSFGSTITSQNDSRQVISNFALGFVTFTAGQAVKGGDNAFIPVPEISVGQGERLYLHSSAAAGVVATVKCVLHFDFDLDKPQVRRR